MTTPVKVCVAGITGWTGRCVAQAVSKAEDLALSAGISRKAAGNDIGETIGDTTFGKNIVASVDDLKEPYDVFVDYTSHDSVKRNALVALSKGARVVIGTSGLTADDFTEIESEARRMRLGVISCGNFSITAALAKRFALMAAKHLPQWEIIDYASAGKRDVPSGTTRELAEELSLIRENRQGHPLDSLHGPKEARGAQIKGTPVHSLRLPSYTIAFETIFGLPNERLTIRHDAGTGAEPYVDGTLLAIRKVASVTGLVRGLDNLIFGDMA